MGKSSFFGPETISLHTGYEPDPAFGSRAVPVYQTTSYVFETVDEKGNKLNQKYVSTAGRFLLASVLPKHHKIKFTLIDRLLTKKNVFQDLASSGWPY